MRTLLKYLWQFYLLFIFLPIGILATVITAIVTIVMSPIAGHRVWGYYPAVAWSKLVCVLTFVRIEVEGKKNISSRASYVIASNHQSIYDVFLIYGYLGTKFKWIMRDELRKVPFIGTACKNAGHIFISRRGGKKALDAIVKAKEILQGGVSVVVFPEGKRTRDGKVGKFKRGAFQIAKDLELPILPITISGGDKVLPHGTKFPVPRKIKLKIHQAVTFSPADIEEERNLISAIRETIISGIDQ